MGKGIVVFLRCKGVFHRYSGEGAGAEGIPQKDKGAKHKHA